MRKIKLSRIICTFMVAITMATSFETTTVFAAEENATVLSGIADTIEPRAGVETIPLNQWYMISSNFSIDGYNYTPCKTVRGQYLKLRVNTYFNSADQGSGPVRVTLKMRDYNSREFIPGTTFTFTLQKGQGYSVVPVFNLEYSGRKIQIYTEITSLNSSDPTTRVLQFYDYEAYSYN